MSTGELIRFDARAALNSTSLSADDLHALSDVMNAARDEVVNVDQPLWESGAEVPSEKKPLDAGFFRLPERVLAAYRKNAETSELGLIKATATRLQGALDKVVVLGIGGSYMGARALMEACCHPYHNQRTREERKGIPRVYFEGNNVDNDTTQALLDVLGKGKDWGIVVISKSGGTLETAVAFRIFLDALRDAGIDADGIQQRVVPVTGDTGLLADLATQLGCQDVFRVPDGVGGRFSVLCPVGLLPAAILGIDVVKLLEGAAAMNKHFCEAPLGENAVLDYVALCHATEMQQSLTIRILSAWANSLESVGLWYDQLLAESLGKEERGATPLTVVNTRDLHSRAQQHQEGMRDKLITNLIVQEWSRPPIKMKTSEFDQDKLNQLAGKTMPELMSAAIAGTNEAYASDGRPTADILLPKIDAYTLGQFFQMMMLATVVEGRLLKINPYGQPGVEKYKKFMKSNLGLA
ncbi:MAG: glucose-6-phosphate isomerase [Planctomycetales bacterium]|nr:glucose-6-phosphate isomerase [Planctomycetales bacterium]